MIRVRSEIAHPCLRGPISGLRGPIPDIRGSIQSLIGDLRKLVVKARLIFIFGGTQLGGISISDVIPLTRAMALSLSNKTIGNATPWPAVS